MHPISLRFVRSFYIRHGIICGFMFAFCILIPLTVRKAGVWAWVAPAVLAAPCFVMVLREMWIAVRQVDDEGVTRGDGKRFLWKDLQKVQDVNWINRNGQQGGLNHVDLIFTQGSARILFQVLENGWEAIQFARKKEEALKNPTPPPPAPEPAPPVAKPEKCPGCGMLGNYHMAMQKHGRENEDTFLPPCPGLKTVRDVRHPEEGKGELEQCSECGAYFFYRSEYEYLATGSEDTQIRMRLTPQEVERLMPAS